MTASRTMVQIEPMTLLRVLPVLAGRAGFLKEDSLEASPGSSAASRRSISASIRCSSIDSAIAPYLRVPRAGGNLYNYPPGRKVYPIVLRLCPALFGTPGDPLPNGFPRKRNPKPAGPAPPGEPNTCLPRSKAGSTLSGMRWDSMRLDADEAGAAAPPLIERGAVARTFDSPEFRGMTFYEVHAKSIVSHVPTTSKMPFTW